MTITKTYAPDKYAGDGVQVDFPVTFDFLDSGNIKATVTDAAGVDTALVAGVDYSVTGATLTTAVPVASGSRLTIWLDADYLQDTDWKNTGNYNLETLERAMDKAAVERQILKEAFSRTVTLPLTSEDTPENYLGQVRAARDAAVTARGGAEAAQAAAESAASTAASDTVAAASSLLSGYVTSAEASKNAAAQSAAEAEAAASNLTAQTAEFTVGVGGQAVFDTVWSVKAEVKNIRLFADGVLQQDAFPCDASGDPVTTGDTHYINAGSTIPEGVSVFISSVDTVALGSITALANSAAASAQSAADDAAAVATTKTEIDDFRNDLLVEPQQKTGTVSAGTNVINLGTTGFRASGVRLYLGGSKQRYGSDYTVNADAGVITLTSAAAFDTTWIADIDSYVVGTTGGGGGGTVAWADVTGKPATFPPSAHTHTIPDVTGLQTALDTQSAAIATKVDQTSHDNEIASLAAAISDRALQTDLVNGLAAKENTLSPSQKLRINVSMSAPTAGDAANYDIWFEVS